MVTKPHTEKFERYMERFQEDLIRAREERVKLQTQVKERSALVEVVRDTVREEMQKGRSEVPEKKTYAEMMAKRVPVGIPKVSGVRGPVLPPSKLVIIRQENKESEEVKKTLKELVKPSQIGLKVKRLSKIKNGVIVETETDEGVEKLLKNEALKKPGLKVGKPMSKKPVIMVYDVKSDLKDEEVKEEVYAKNMEGSEMTEEDFKEEFQV